MHSTCLHSRLAGQSGSCLGVDRVRTFISSGSDSHLRVRVDLAAPIRRVRVRNGFLQAWTSLGRTVLVALHTVEGLLSGIQDEVGWVVAKEALAHVHNWLNGRCRGAFIDDCPNRGVRNAGLLLTQEANLPDIKSIASNPRCRLQFACLGHGCQMKAAQLRFRTKNGLPEYGQNKRSLH